MKNGKRGSGLVREERLHLSSLWATYALVQT
jgi:hypothetical protein